jgi:hypothetical protein
MLRTHQLGKDQCKHPKNPLDNQKALEKEMESEWEMESEKDHQWLSQWDQT